MQELGDWKTVFEKADRKHETIILVHSIRNVDRYFNEISDWSDSDPQFEVPSDFLMMRVGDTSYMFAEIRSRRLDNYTRRKMAMPGKTRVFTYIKIDSAELGRITGTGTIPAIRRFKVANPELSDSDDDYDESGTTDDDSYDGDTTDDETPDEEATRDEESDEERTDDEESDEETTDDQVSSDEETTTDPQRPSIPDLGYMAAQIQALRHIVSTQPPTTRSYVRVNREELTSCPLAAGHAQTLQSELDRKRHITSKDYMQALENLADRLAAEFKKYKKSISRKDMRKIRRIRRALKSLAIADWQLVIRKAFSKSTTRGIGLCLKPLHYLTNKR